MIISSLDNPLIKRVLQLHEKKGRKEHQQCIVEGVRVCETFFEQGMRLYHLFVTQAMQSKVHASCPAHKIVVVSERVMSKISTSTTPCGMLAVFAIPMLDNATLSAGIVLAQIQDPGNAGTLIRTAAALNKKTVIMIESVEAWSPKVLQASAGAHAMVNIFSLSWQELLERKGKLQLGGLVVSGGKSPAQVNLSESLLVVGNEANGLPEPWQKNCDTLLTLPMPGNTESLNAAIAGSVALYCSYLHNQK